MSKSLTSPTRLTRYVTSQGRGHPPRHDHVASRHLPTRLQLVGACQAAMGTDLCEILHGLCRRSGRARLRMADGTERPSCRRQKLFRRAAGTRRLGDCVAGTLRRRRLCQCGSPHATGQVSDETKVTKGTCHDSATARSRPAAPAFTRRGRAPSVSSMEEVVVKVSGTETAGTYAVVTVRVAPGGGPPLHAHPTDETFYVLSGAFSSPTATRAASGLRAEQGATVTLQVGAAPFENVGPAPGSL